MTNDESMTKLEASMCAARIFVIRHSKFLRHLVIRASPFPSFIEEREHQLAFGDDCVVHYAVALRFRHAIATRSRQLGVNENRVAWKNRFAKFHLVRAHEIADTTRSLRQFEQKNTGHLRHRFYLHYSRHDWMTGEMPLKNGSLIVMDFMAVILFSPSKPMTRSTIKKGSGAEGSSSLRQCPDRNRLLGSRAVRSSRFSASARERAREPIPHSQHVRASPRSRDRGYGDRLARDRR